MIEFDFSFHDSILRSYVKDFNQNVFMLFTSHGFKISHCISTINNHE